MTCMLEKLITFEELLIKRSEVAIQITNGWNSTGVC